MEEEPTDNSDDKKEDPCFLEEKTGALDNKRESKQSEDEVKVNEDEEVQDVSSEGGNTSENDSNNVEQKLEDDIVEKLMNYAGGKFKPTIVHQDSMSLLDILPMEWADALQDIGMNNVSDISLGRRPYCWYNHQRKYLSEDASYVVNERDIQDVVASLQALGMTIVLV